MQASSLLGHTQELLGTILSSSKPADHLIDFFFRSRKYLGSRDRRFIAETTYGTLRHLRRTRALVERGTAHIDLFPEDQVLLLAAAYLISTYSTDTPTADDIRTRLKGNRIKEGLDNILASFDIPLDEPTEQAQRIGLRYSFPDWMIQRLLAECSGEEVERLCEALNDTAPLTIRVNTLKTTREECRAVLESQDCSCEPTQHSPLGLQIRKRTNVFALDTFRNGWFEVQDEGSQLLPLLLDPKPTDKVLDACAGAGGKSLELSALMKNRGEIMATDVHTTRLDELRKRVKRSGSQNIRVRDIDSIKDLESDRKEFFDLVLVDAPCSGLGTIRRNPGMKWSVTELTVNEVSARQRMILADAAPLVKRGGRLAYATCTFLRQENEEVGEWFLAAHPEFRSIAPRGRIAGIASTNAATVKLMPHLHGTDGFFLQIFQRSD